MGSLGLLFSAQTFDTIVLLDTSESMFGYFNSSVDYLIQDIIKNQLKQGDTFHLLSFADTPEYEISKKIRTSKDIESILSRILLLKPLGKYTDLISALEYLNNYAGSLSPATRKKIIILTDGIHDPPPSASHFSDQDVISKVKLITENMKRQGWDVSLVRFPLSGADSGYKSGDNGDNEASGAGSGSSENNVLPGKEKEREGIDLFPELSKELKTDIIEYDSDKTALSHKATGSPLIIFPENLGEVGRTFEIPFKVKNYLPHPVQVKLKSVLVDGKENILKDEVMKVVKPESTSPLDAEVSLPESYKPGEYDLSVDLVFPSDTRPYPRKGTISFVLEDTGSFSGSAGFVLKVIMYVIAAAVLLFVLILLIRKFFSGISLGGGTGRAPRKVSRGTKSGPLPADVSAASHKRTGSEPASRGERKTASSSSPAKSASGSPVKSTSRFTESPDGNGGKVYEMLVSSQNRHVGFRNIHLLKENSVLTVGGSGSDDYLIFIYPVDGHIAEVELKNGVPYFRPVKKEFFPDFSADAVRLDSGEIKVTSSDSAVFSVSFREWIPPAERINKILHLIDNPGLPDFDY